MVGEIDDYTGPIRVLISVAQLEEKSASIQQCYITGLFNKGFRLKKLKGGIRPTHYFFFSVTHGRELLYSRVFFFFSFFFLFL